MLFKNILKIISFTNLAFLIFIFLAPKPVYAFLPIDSVTLIAQSIMPFAGSLIVIFITNIILIIKKVPKKYILLVSIVLLFVVGNFLFKSYLRYKMLRVSNQFDIEEIAEYSISNEVEKKIKYDRSQMTAPNDKFWNGLLDKAKENKEQYFDSEDFINGTDADAFYARRFSKEELSEIISSGKYKILDITDNNITIKNAQKVSNFPWQVYKIFDDEDEINGLLSSYNITKKEPVFIFCEYGFTSSHIASIMHHYGYIVYHGGVAYLDESVFDVESSYLTSSRNIFIDLFEYDDKDKYLYILLDGRDSRSFDDQPFEDFNINPSKFYLVDVINSSSVLDGSFGSFSEDMILSENEFKSLDLSQYKVVCRNKAHCFFVKHYLAYQDSEKVKKLYCLHCQDEYSF